MRTLLQHRSPRSMSLRRWPPLSQGWSTPGRSSCCKSRTSLRRVPARPPTRHCLRTPVACVTLSSPADTPSLVFPTHSLTHCALLQGGEAILSVIAACPHVTVVFVPGPAAVARLVVAALSDALKAGSESLAAWAKRLPPAAPKPPHPVGMGLPPRHGPVGPAAAGGVDAPAGSVAGSGPSGAAAPAAPVARVAAQSPTRRPLSGGLRSRFRLSSIGSIRFGPDRAAATHGAATSRSAAPHARHSRHVPEYKHSRCGQPPPPWGPAMAH